MIRLYTRPNTDKRSAARLGGAGEGEPAGDGDDQAVDDALRSVRGLVGGLDGVLLKRAHGDGLDGAGAGEPAAMVTTTEPMMNHHLIPRPVGLPTCGGGPAHARASDGEMEGQSSAHVCAPCISP